MIVSIKALSSGQLFHRTVAGAEAARRSNSRAANRGTTGGFTMSRPPERQALRFANTAGVD